MTKVTLNNVDFTVSQLDDGLWILEAANSLHHATWKKCVKESGLDVCYGDWQRGNMMTWNIETLVEKTA